VRLLFLEKMKVFFDATYQGHQYFGDFYEEIYNEISNIGHTNLINDAVRMTEDMYKKELGDDRKRQNNYYSYKIENLKKADICVFDVSYHSLGIGYMIQRALEEGKPTIALFHKDNNPIFLEGIEDERFILIPYDKKNLKDVLKKSLKKASDLRDKRFNFFITPNLLRYLNRVSRTDGVTKSVFIRNLIMEHMRRNSA